MNFAPPPTKNENNAWIWLLNKKGLETYSVDFAESNEQKSLCWKVFCLMKHMNVTHAEVLKELVLKTQC